MGETDNGLWDLLEPLGYCETPGCREKEAKTPWREFPATCCVGRWKGLVEKDSFPDEISL